MVWSIRSLEFKDTSDARSSSKDANVLLESSLFPLLSVSTCEVVVEAHRNPCAQNAIIFAWARQTCDMHQMVCDVV